MLIPKAQPVRSVFCDELCVPCMSMLWHKLTQMTAICNSTMHAQDAVVRGGKLVRMYKRPGHRVIINTDGDLIVRPMFIEASIQRVPGGSSVSHHVLAAYQRSYVAVMKSQFCRKGVQGGREVRRGHDSGAWLWHICAAQLQRLDGVHRIMLDQEGTGLRKRSRFGSHNCRQLTCPHRANGTSLMLLLHQRLSLACDTDQSGRTCTSPHCHQRLSSGHSKSCVRHATRTVFVRRGCCVWEHQAH